MNKDKNKKLNSKVLSLLLTVSVSVILFFSIFAFATMNKIRGDARKTNEELGAEASSSSEGAMERQAKQYLSSLATDKARVVDEKILDYENFVEMASRYISSIYSNPNSFSDYPVDRPEAVSEGGYMLEYTVPSSDSGYLDSIYAELSKAGNVIYAFDPIIRSDESISSIYFCSESGFMITYDTYPADTLHDFDPRMRQWYIDAKAYGNSWSSAYVDAFTGKLVTSYSCLCYNSENELIGVVSIDIVLDDFTKIASEAHISGENAHAFLVTKDGYFIAYTDGTPVAELEEIISSAPIDGGEPVTIKLNGEDTLLALINLTRSNWRLGLTMSLADVKYQAAQIKETILAQTDDAVKKMDSDIITAIYVFAFIIICAVFIIIFFSFRFTRKIIEPIMALTDGVKEISSGNLDYAISVTTGDEIEGLADAFNKMTGDIKDYIQSVSGMTAEKERIATELTVASNIQASMLPSEFPAFPDNKNIDIYAVMEPAREVGGDFYDFFLLDDERVCAVIADVSGKGVAAALFMVTAKTMIKNLALSGIALEDVFYQANNSLCEGNTSDMFVTALMVVLNFRTGELNYINAGHNHPFVCKKDGGVIRLDLKRRLALAAMEDISFEEQAARLNEGDSLFLYTDGVTEAMNAADELYSEERLIERLKATEDVTELKDILLRIRKDIDIFVDGEEQSDDMTMLILKYCGE